MEQLESLHFGAIVYGLTTARLTLDKQYPISDSGTGSSVLIAIAPREIVLPKTLITEAAVRP